MRKTLLLALVLTLLLAWSTKMPAEAASKYKACSLLTAAELEAALGAKVSRTDEGDIVINEGPYKGETMSSCSWVIGSSQASLNILRGPQTPAQRAAGLAVLRDTDEQLKKQGWTIVDVTIGGVTCANYRPPAGQNLPPVASCALESKGYALSLSVFGLNASAQQVKTLIDKAVARLR